MITGFADINPRRNKNAYFMALAAGLISAVQLKRSDVTNTTAMTEAQEDEIRKHKLAEQNLTRQQRRARDRQKQKAKNHD